MRKILFIFAALVCCLVWNPGGATSVSGTVRPAAVLSVDRAAADAWRCEREYNSDLNLPRLCPVGAPAAVTPWQSRSCHASSVQKARLLAAAHRGADALKITSSFNLSLFAALPHAVDRYVYRLRRLII